MSSPDYSYTRLLTNLRKRATDLGRALKMVWQASGYWTAGWAAMLLVQGALPAAIVYLTKILVDAVDAAAGAGLTPETIRLVLTPTLVMVGLLILRELLKSAIRWLRTVQGERVEDYLATRIHRQAYTVGMDFFEASENYDLLHRARESAGSRPVELVETLGGIAQNLVTLLAMLGVLLPYGLWVPAVLVLSMLPAFYVVIHYSLRYHNWWEASTPEQRRAQYYSWILTFSEAAAEVRLFSLGPHFADAYRRLRRKLRGEELTLERERELATFGAGLFALVATGGILGWIGTRVIAGTATLGDVALFYQAFNQGQGLMKTLMQNLGQIYSNSLFLNHLFAFLDAEPLVADPAQPKPMPEEPRHHIRFREVTFAYPGTEQPALRNFSLDIPAGQTVALVGANGAGKSTLLKLLCRFYDPQEGAIEIDGTNLRAFKLEQLRDRIAVLFQSPVRYHETAEQNIALGASRGTAPSRPVEAMAQAAGAHDIIQRLPDGYATQLGRWFWSGVDLSGGEWQRVALARSFFRDAPIVLLDEPTSAMDSWAEHEWLTRFRRLVDGRTALIITHRFTTAMRADVIYVMDKGRIIEQGNHEALLQQNGRYAASWRKQVRNEESGADPFEQPPPNGSTHPFT